MVFYTNLNSNYYTSGNSFSNDFTPRQLLNLKLWLDGNQGIITNGPSAVAVWRAKSPNGVENLAAQSQTIGTSPWVNIGTTLTQNQTAPDGTSTATLITASGAGAIEHGMSILASPTLPAKGTVVGSAYLKQSGPSSWISLGSRQGNARKSAWFNLSTGAVGTKDSGVTATISPDDHGYYRCQASWTFGGASDGSSDVEICPVTGDGTTQAYSQSGEAVLAWGVQLERGTVATKYLATTTAVSGVNVIQDTGGDRPIYNTNPLNNLPTLQFIDATPTYMGSTSSDLAPSAAITFTAVSRYTTAQSISFISGRGSTGDQGYWLADLSTSNPTGQIANGTTLVRPGAGTDSTNTWAIKSLTYDGANATLYQNGTAGTPLAITGSIDYTGVNTFYVGQESDLTAGRGLTGDIAEVVEYSVTLSATNLRRLHKYLERKYAIAGI